MSTWLGLCRYLDRLLLDRHVKASFEGFVRHVGSVGGVLSPVQGLEDMAYVFFSVAAIYQVFAQAININERPRIIDTTT